jgi:hypothetical protein
MAEEKSTTQTDAGAAGQVPAAQAAATPQADDIAALKKQIEELRKEAGDRRVAAKKAEEEKTAAERTAAEKAGDVVKLTELSNAEKKALQEKLDALGPKATRAERLESILKAEVESYEKQVGPERAQAVAHLAPEDRLPILKQFAAMAAGPGAAKSSTSAPPAGHAQTVDFNKMSGADLDAHFAGKSPEEIKAAIGVKKTSGWFGR